MALTWMSRRCVFLMAMFSGLVAEIPDKKGFILLSPKLLTAGTVERLSLNLFGISTDGTINVKLTEKENASILAETQILTSTWNGSGIYLTIPYKQDLSPFARLQVTGIFKDDNYTINATKEVGLKQKRILILASTDKAVYNPGQSVKFRVLVVTNELKLPTENLVGEIEITDPNQVHVALWNNISFSEGIVTEKLQLPDEPQKGFWYITVQIGNFNKKISFDVTEHVLPKFDVIITPPSYLLKSDKHITWKICARYTYGMPVEGLIKLDVHYRTYFFELVPLQPQAISRIRGCYPFTVNIPSQSPKGAQLAAAYTYFELNVEVIEQGTGAKVIKKNRISISSSPLIFGHLENELLHFKHGLPLKRTLSVKKPDDSPAARESIELCMTVTKEKWSVDQWTSNKRKTCKTFTSTEEGLIHFTLPAQNYDTTSIVLKATSLREEFQNNSDYHPVSYNYFSPWYSPSGSHLLIEPIIGKLKCGEENTIKVKYTADKLNSERIFYFQLVSVNGIDEEGFLPHTFGAETDQSHYTDDTYLPTMDEAFCPKFEENQKKHFPFPPYVGEFSLILTSKLTSPVLRLLVYYINEDGETVGDSRTFPATPCFENQVTLHFEGESKKPGSRVSQHLKASPFSVCSIEAVDKSVTLLGDANRITEEQIANELLEFDTGRYYLIQESEEKEYCSKFSDFGSGEYEKAFTDSIEAFENARLLVITDFSIEHQPCFPNSLEWGQCINSGGYGVSRNGNGEKSITIGSVREDSDFTQARTYFPDTWLWEMHNLDEKGELILNKQLPDTITEWISGAICISHDTGLGIAINASITTFNPFFVSVDLPYSIIRGEITPITVTVFNYMKGCLPVDIFVEETNDFTLPNGTMKTSVCVCEGKSITHKFIIKPKTLGEINITATGHSGASEEVCGNFNSESNFVTDTVIKQLLVKPEGYERKQNFNSFFCTKDYKDGIFGASYSLNLPEDVVEGSARAYVSISGDLMGPMLNGIEKLVQLPSGCGEQNMVHFVPNIMVLEYLSATGKQDESLKRKSLSNIKKGYLQQLTYKRNDGSYSAFGKLDKEGSLWLSSFVYQSFSLAMKYIYVDKAVLNSTLLWILDKQHENGCFYSVGTVHHRALKGGVAVNDRTPATLTAYVLISLMAAQTPVLPSVARGLQCLEATTSPTNYSLSLFCYAAALARHPSANSYIQLLEQRATLKDDTKYWESRSHEIDVETAAYVVLALLKIGGSENFQKAAPIVRWISKQRNQNGGFVSTQDTVLALQALTQYAIYISEEPQNLSVEVTSGNQEYIDNFQLTKTNSLIQQTKKISTPPSLVNVQTSGSGCAVLQVSLQYNIHSAPPSSGFQLSVEATRSSSRFCNRAYLKACISYNSLETSNMVVVEIEMASGYQPDPNSLETLLLNDTSVRRYESNSGKVNIYISEMRNETKCLPFMTLQAFEIEDMKPATAKVYDYYDQEHSIFTSYAILDSANSDC